MIDPWMESSFDLHRCKSIHDRVADSFTLALAPAVRAARRGRRWRRLQRTRSRPLRVPKLRQLVPRRTRLQTIISRPCMRNSQESRTLELVCLAMIGPGQFEVGARDTSRRCCGRAFLTSRDALRLRP
jgi:hypothetical protein